MFLKYLWQRQIQAIKVLFSYERLYLFQIRFIVLQINKKTDDRMDNYMDKLKELRAEVGRVIVGQSSLVDGLLTAMLCGGHVLLVGRPGLGKTLAAKTLANCIGGTFSRLQFTPDMLPSDIVGYQSYIADEHRLEVKVGPVCANLVLADEINRAPAKVQSALLEAMQERQVTIAGETFLLPDPYMVIATRNPLEQQGTYPLPEAQKDRFLLEIQVDYPVRDEELGIMERMGSGDVLPAVQQCLTCEELLELRRQTDAVFIDSRIKEYILDIVMATRPGHAAELSPMQGDFQWCADKYVENGASPRASLGLLRASKAHALLDGRSNVIPEDVRQVAPSVLAHRLMMNFEAEACHLTAMDFVAQILDTLRTP